LQLMISQGDLKTILLILNENLQEPGPSPPFVPPPSSPLPDSPSKTPVIPTGQCDILARFLLGFSGFLAPLLACSIAELIVWVTDVCLSVWMPPNFFFKSLLLHPALSSIPLFAANSWVTCWMKPSISQPYFIILFLLLLQHVSRKPDCCNYMM